MSKEVCIECGMFGNVNGCGVCELCDEEMRERGLDGRENKDSDMELLEEWSKLGFEMVSVKCLEV